MTIVPISGPAPHAARPAARRGGPTGFTLPATAQASQEVAEAEPMAPVSLGALLSLQEVEPPGERDSRARRHAHAILEELRGLQLGLLGDAPDPQRLDRLARLVDSMPEAASPGLQAALASVALRAAVERARYEMMPAASVVQRRNA
jgi:hypothetical protein